MTAENFHNPVQVVRLRPGLGRGDHVLPALLLLAGLPLPTESGGYGECSGTTPDSALTIGYVQAGVQPGGGGEG
jgi:hypothetical protein